MGARKICLPVVGLSLFLCAEAGAFPSSRLVYARGPGAERCPGEETLRQAVTDRLGYDPFFPWADVTIVARIESRGPALAGTVELVDKSGLVKGSRALETSAAQCDQLVSSMALAISIAVDPDSLDRGAAPPVQKAKPEEVEPPAEFWVKAAAPAPMRDAPPRRQAVSRKKHRAPARWEVHGLFAVSTGYAPSEAYGPGLGLRVRISGLSVGVEGRYQFVRDLAMGGGYLPQSDVALESSVIDVAATLCAHDGVLFSCVLGDIGILRVRGTGLAFPRTDWGPIVRAGTRAGMEFPLGAQLGIRVHADLVFNITRPGASLAGSPGWEAPLLGALGGAGLFGHFR